MVLAAGGSRRLGTPKQLLPWEGVPFIRQIVQTALQAELEKVIVITGSDRVEVESALSGLPVETIYNEHWQRGQSTSMQLGLTSLPDRCDGVLFMLSDQPQTSVILLRQLVERFSETGASIVAPQVNQQRGNPVLFSNEVFHSLLQINGDQGGRSLLSAHSLSGLR